MPIPDELWAKVPPDAQAAITAVFLAMRQRIEPLEARVHDLEGRLMERLLRSRKSADGVPGLLADLAASRRFLEDHPRLREVPEADRWRVRSGLLRLSQGLAVATALGVGTTVGCKRIVLTVGEKIGKGHLTNAYGYAKWL